MAITTHPQPAELFEEILPDWWERYGLAELVSPALAGELEVAVEGEGGGVWTVVLDRGELSVEAGEALDPCLALSQSAATWRRGMVELWGWVRDNLESQVARLKAHAEALPLGPQLVERLAEEPGVVTFRLDRRTAPSLEARLAICGGGGQDSRCTVVLPPSALQPILEGRARLLELMLSGRLRLEGDKGYVLRLIARIVAK